MTQSCSRCGKKFANPRNTQNHINDAHQGDGKVLKVKQPRRIDREPSMAERAIDAELAIAMGEHTDDAWLLP